MQQRRTATLEVMVHPAAHLLFGTRGYTRRKFFVLADIGDNLASRLKCGIAAKWQHFAAIVRIISLKS